MGDMESIFSPSIWTSLADIMLVNVVLSGDNAMVVALAAQGLLPKQQRRAVVFGTAAAVFMRIVLTIFALKLLILPGLKIIGGIFLFYVAVKLMTHQRKPDHVAHQATLGSAIKTILIADLVMSLDNVLGVAAAAKGNLALLVVGLVLSIPMIVFGSAVMLKLMRRFPSVIVMGAALLGYLAGDMLFADTALRDWEQTYLPGRGLVIGATGLTLSVPGAVAALTAIGVGAWRSRSANSA
jgi:YjbE family integral membrane protein